MKKSLGRLSVRLYQNPQFRELMFTARMFKRDNAAIVCLGILGFLYFLAVFGPWVAPHDPYEIKPGNILEAPSSKFLFGTDSLGRDLLSRLIYGARLSMFFGVIVVSCNALIGLPFGAVSGYMGGRADDIMMRIGEILTSFPGLALVLILTWLFGRGFTAAIIAMSIGGWFFPARLIRSVVLLEKEKDYVKAAKVLGKSGFSVLFREILPNAIHPLICQSTINIGYSIISFAGLSFIGVGTQPPEPDWGSMIALGRDHLMTEPWVAITPGIFIILATLSFTVVGDTLRDALDPRLRRQI